MPECVPGNPSIRVLAAEVKQWGCQRINLFLSVFIKKKKIFFWTDESLLSWGVRRDSLSRDFASGKKLDSCGVNQ
jgi:hypothetical protein